MTAAKPLPIVAESELPEGWAEVSLEQLLSSLESGSRPKGGVRGIQEGIPSIGGEHLNESGGFRFDKLKFVPSKFFSKMTRGHIQPGDILIVKDGATTGKVSFVRDDFPYQPAVVNEHVFVCRVHPPLVPTFLFYFLFGQQGQERLMENFRGSAQGGITQTFAPNTIVPLAPLVEQRRIVEKVEQLLARVDAARERLAHVPAILKRFRQAVLAAAFSGRLTADWREIVGNTYSATELLRQINPALLQTTVPDADDTFDLPEIPEGWQWIRCQDICERKRPITYGVIKLGPPIEKGIPTLRSSDVRWLWIDESQIKRISPTIAAAYSRTFLKGGEILVTVRGSLGGVAVVPVKMAGFNISREVAMLPAHPKLDPNFFCYAIGSPWSRAWLARVAIGVAYTGINIRDLKRLPLPFPPLEEQGEIVRRVENLFKLTDAIEKRVAAATLRAEKLTQATLAKAFHGELVPTEAELARREGRDYEPASVLLERIRAERANNNSYERPRRKTKRTNQERGLTKASRAKH